MEAMRARADAGFTLLEVLMAAAIGAVLMTALAASSSFFLDSYATGLDEQDLSLSYHIAAERMRRTITTAAEVTVESPAALVATLPGGGTERYSWSGVAGEPLMLSIDGGEGLPVVDGVTALAIAPHMVNCIEEETHIDPLDFLSFETYGNPAQVWEDHALGPDSSHGLTFCLLYTQEVEKMELQSIEARLGKAAGQLGDLKVVLVEGQDESRPRPWGDALASHVVTNPEIPAVWYDAGEMQVDWFTIALPEGFVFQPNRFYCLLFQANDGGEAGYLRVSNLTGGTGPINSMAYLGTDDAGCNWEPELQTQAYRQRDVPIRLHGLVTYKVRYGVARVKAVDIDLRLALGGRQLSGLSNVELRGGGDF